ncbi:MAG: hypothetical protein WAW61_13025 [Methylococcaceae bacterium]
MKRTIITGLVEERLTVRAGGVMFVTAGNNPATGRRNLAEQAKNRHNPLWLFYARHFLNAVLNRVFQWRALNGSVRAGCACSQFSTHSEPAAIASGGLFL